MREFEILNPMEDAGDAWFALTVLYGEIDVREENPNPIISYSSGRQEDKYVYYVNLDVYDARNSTPEKVSYCRVQLPILKSDQPQDEIAEKLFTIYLHTRNEFMESLKEFFAACRHKELRVIDLDGEEYVVPLEQQED